MSSQTKQVVENVRRFFEKEKECRSNINRQTVVKRTAEATGISERSVRDIHKASLVPRPLPQSEERA